MRSIHLFDYSTIVRKALLLSGIISAEIVMGSCLLI